MNLQESIKKVLREENTLPNLIRRRFSEEELYKLVSNVERTFETHRISKQHREDVIDAEVDDFIMNSIYYGEFEDFDDEIYQEIYNLYREPLVDYIKSKIDMNLQESIKKILREETEDITKKILNFLKRRFKVKKIPVRDEKTSRIVKTLFFEKNGKTWAIEKGLNERHQIAIILDVLITFEVIDPFNIYKRDFDYNEQKIVDAIKIFIDEVSL